MSYKDYTWEVIAGDFNSPFFRNYIWTNSPLAFSKLFDLPIPRLGIVSRENAISYVAEMKSWTETHEALKAQALKNFSIVEKIIDDTNTLGEAFNAWSEKEIFQADLVQKTPDELMSLARSFAEKQSLMYSYGITMPILDFLGFAFVERKVKDFLKTKVSETEFQHAFDTLTFPLHDSFAQDQETELLKLMAEYYTESWKQNILSKKSDELKKFYPEFYKKLETHTAAHAWVYYVYLGPAFTDKHFLDFIKDYLSKNIVPTQKLKELEEKKAKAAVEREALIKRLQPDPENESFLRLASKLVWAKPRRKDYQSRSYYHIEKLHREISKCTFLSLSQVRSAPIELLEKALKGERVDTSIVNSIYKLHVCLPENNGVTTLYGTEAQEFCEKYLKKEDEQDYKGIQELKGTIASPGRKTGKVKIINRPEDMEKMEEGDILVSMATTPSIVPAMKKAGAIVTDEGGLTCHAAIVSRELGITCLIGTKIATKIFKDGDMVEVDAQIGVVRIIT